MSSQTSTAHKPVKPWRGVGVGHHYVPPHEALGVVAPHYAIDLNLTNAYHLEWKYNGAFRRTWMIPGSLCILPAHESLSMRWESNLEMISVQLDPSWLIRTAEEMKVSGQIEIPEQHGEVDAQIGHLCQALWSESQSGFPTGRIFGESLATALSSRLLQCHGIRRPTQPREGRLSPRQWNLLSDFIESHLENDLSLDELAGLVRLSPYHFSRCFKATVGTSPHQYIITRRIERARYLLSKSKIPLAQVAAQCGFADQSHLTRHMKRHLGVTPAVLCAQYQNNRKNVL